MHERGLKILDTESRREVAESYREARFVPWTRLMWRPHNYLRGEMECSVGSLEPRPAMTLESIIPHDIAILIAGIVEAHLSFKDPVNADGIG